MKNPMYDPETKETYDCENEYEFKIKSFMAKHEYMFTDDEVIEYVIKIKSNIIDDLEKNNSKSDKIRVKHIKWVEDRIDEIHDFIIQNKTEIPKALENHKTFVYQTGKKTVGRPKGRSKQTDAQDFPDLVQSYVNKAKIGDSYTEFPYTATLSTVYVT